MTREELVQAVMDAIEQRCTPEEYYQLNHASADDIEILAGLIVWWCSRIKIRIE